MIPAEHDAFYAALTSRNRGLLAPREQYLVRTTRFVLAGCGSTGGACVLPLVRSGAEHFVLLDPGTYELDNLNRQDATLEDVGANKATVQARRITAVNPYATAEVHSQGVQVETIARVLRPGDLVVDAVDVTTQAGVNAKLALHEAASRLHLRVLTAYDIATTQYLELFDYRYERQPLGGRVAAGLGPNEVLRALIPARVLPRGIFPELHERLRDPDRPLPQLMMTSTLLGALIVPYLVRVLLEQPVRRRLRVDLWEILKPLPVAILERQRRWAGLARLWWAFRRERSGHA
jgi:hypothetical protein